MIDIRWHGRGGQGAFTASKLLGESIALYSDQYALAFPSFGPERRGAPVLAFTKIDARKIQDRSEVKFCDYIVILDETLFNPAYFLDLKPGGKVILNTQDASRYNPDGKENLLSIDATDIAQSILGKPIANTAMIGALAGISGLVEEAAILQAISHYFKGELLEKNKEVIRRTFQQSKNTFRS